MARPIKTGLDYFPLDVYMDDKIELIEAKHGLIGFGLIIKLYQNIYKNGYHFDVNEEKVLVLKKRVNVDINIINEVINDACRWDIFSEKLYKKYTILTSTGIQKRFIEATKRRSEISFVKEYLLVKDIVKLYGEKVIVNINSINTDISTQRRVKNNKSIIKEKNNIFSQDSMDVLKKLNDLSNKNFREIENNLKHIESRLKEKFTKDDCFRVLENKIKDQYFIDNPKYYNPETLFRLSNFEKYLNEAPKINFVRMKQPTIEELLR